MLAAVSLGLVALPLMAVLMVVAQRIARGVEPALRHVTLMTGEYPSLPVGFRYDAVMPGPLQLVDDDVPSTKVCPDCAETVIASARVCKHCQFRFEPPLHGSATA
jgi:hypothetical protein